MTPERVEEYKQRMSKWTGRQDREEAHIEADYILCQMLKELGYIEIIEIYEQIDKWYA